MKTTLYKVQKCKNPLCGSLIYAYQWYLNPYGDGRYCNKFCSEEARNYRSLVERREIAKREAKIKARNSKKYLPIDLS